MPKYELNLWDYWRIIRKRSWIIIGVFLAVVLSTFVYSYRQTSIYEASTKIRIYARAPIVTIAGANITLWEEPSKLESEVELIKSDKVLKEVVKNLRYVDGNAKDVELQNAIANLRSKLTTERVEYTDLVEIKVRDSNPKEAMRIVMEVAYAYIEENWQKKVNDAKATREFIEKQLEITGEKLKEAEQALKELKEKGEAVGTVIPLQDKMTELESKLTALTKKYTDNHPQVIAVREEIKLLQEQLKTLPEKELVFARLSRDLKTNEDLHSMLKEEYAKAQILEASKTKDVELINPAVEPKAPISPNRTNNIFIGVIIGIILGLVVAVITESLDASIGTIEDVEEYLKLPVLGVIPYIKLEQDKVDYWKKRPAGEDKESYELIELMGRLITQFRATSPIAEAYRSLQTNIGFSGLDKVGNSFVFTSVGTKEGKTITTTNCALSFAQAGKRVLLVDADLRRPAIHKIFGIKREAGLNEVIIGSLKLDEAIKTINDILLGEIKAAEILKTHGIENLSILTSGHLPTNPPELLGSKKMTDLINEVKKNFDVVLFDCAPILPVTDAMILGSKVNGAILVYEVGKVARGALRRAKIQLENAKANPIGVVLNNIRASEMKAGYPYYHYYYTRYYSEVKEEKK